VFLEASHFKVTESKMRLPKVSHDTKASTSGTSVVEIARIVFEYSKAVYEAT